ncbi:MAG: ABC transporter permease subunit [Spirochaetes bacterium]|nr:ABC transporter permease subunit [Spirochaetota bacterium]
MHNTMTIFRRELRAFYISPLYYILGFIYLALTGFFFTVDIHYVKMAVMENSLYNIGFFSILFLSILCIKLISEEKSSGTFEIIMTSPITSFEYVLGKYLAVLVVYASLLGITLIYPILLMIFGSPDIGVIFSGYLGLLFLGSAILGLGLIASSITRSQLVSAILGVSLALIAYIINWISELFEPARKVLEAISPTNQFANFTKGLIDVQNIVFFLIWIMVSLTISTLIVESYKWN